MAAKTQTFVWEGADRRGARISGETEAQSIALAKADLRRQGITPLKVKKKPTPLFTARKQAILTKDIAVFSRQLATMLSAGVPLVQSLDIVARGHENASMRELVDTIRSEVESGTSLSESLRKHPLQFDALYCNLVNAGEQAGVLETLLHKIADYKEKTESLKAKIKKALFYPTAVIVVAVIVTAILLIFVVPQFEDLFSGFGADLPAFTKMVINISEFFQNYWWAMAGGITGAVYGFSAAKKRSVPMQEALDRMSLKIPVVGNILNKAAIARFCRTLSTMFAAGVPLVEALDSVSGAVGNVVYRKATERIRDEVATGQQLQTTLQQAGLFPNIVIQMVAIGEESGSLDAMLGKVADFFEEEVDNLVDALTSLLEPLIMSVLGVLVGGLVVSMYLPIFKLGSSI